MDPGGIFPGGFQVIGALSVMPKNSCSGREKARVNCSCNAVETESPPDIKRISGEISYGVAVWHAISAWHWTGKGTREGTPMPLKGLQNRLRVTSGGENQRGTDVEGRKHQTHEPPPIWVIGVSAAATRSRDNPICSIRPVM